jgi:hypothetical protein
LPSSPHWVPTTTTLRPLIAVIFCFASLFQFIA